MKISASFLQKLKKKRERTKKFKKKKNARKEKRKIKAGHIKYTRDITEKIQLNSVKTRSLNAGENVRSLGKFYKMNIIVL